MSCGTAAGHPTTRADRAGWDRAFSGDPMFMLHLAATELGVPSQVTKHDIVRWLAGRPRRLHAHSRQPFRKVGTRSAQAIAKIVVAGVWEKQPRLAIGSVAGIPLRLSATGEALGRGATVAEAQEILQREIAPSDDLRSTAEYRRQVAANLLRQF